MSQKQIKLWEWTIVVDKGKVFRQCRCCNARVKFHMIKMNSDLVRLLIKGAEQYAVTKKPFDRKKLNLTRFEYSNYRKLELRWLTEKVGPDEFLVTHAAYAFLWWHQSIFKYVLMFNEEQIGRWSITWNHFEWWTEQKRATVTISDFDTMTWNAEIPYEWTWNAGNWFRMTSLFPMTPETNQHERDQES